MENLSLEQQAIILKGIASQILQMNKPSFKIIEELFKEFNIDFEGNQTYTRMYKSNRQLAMKWWNKMNLEEQFYITIKNNDLLIGDTVDNHPSRLTGREIEEIWNKEVNHS